MTSVLVVDDSQFMRTVIGDILADEGYDVRRVSSGEAAVEAVADHDPDIVTMDVEMPGIGGIEAVERIMATNPTRILMLSAHTQRGADATLEALAHGAVDFLAKPSGEVSTDIHQLGDRLVETIEAVERADLSAVTSGRTRDRTASATTSGSGAGTATATLSATGSDGGTDPEGGTAAASPTGSAVTRRPTEHPTVVIAASTGGPGVIESVLESLPGSLDARVLVVQHMPRDFTRRLAARLDDLSAYDVSEAEDNQRVEPGDAVVARGGYHMAVRRDAFGKLWLSLTEDDRRHGVRPSADVTMETAAETVEGPLVGVSLTGMGADGAAGIRAIHEAGGYTIAQDEETSAVFGMPQQAIETGCVDAVLPAEAVPDGIVTAFETRGETHG